LYEFDASLIAAHERQFGILNVFPPHNHAQIARCQGWLAMKHEIPALTAGFSWLYFKND
jgi:hypothetical protein